mgnify:CR=1 FL=1
MSEERWERLDVWNLSDILAYKVYMLTKSFPKDELYGLTSQLRRAALSIPTNIVEGYSRKGDKELSRFLNISLGSLAETKYLLHFAQRLSLIGDQEYNELKADYESLGKMLWMFYKSVQ